MRIGVAATPAVAIPTLDWLLNSSHDLALVITRPDQGAGRGKVTTESEVAIWAKAHGLPVIKPETAMDMKSDISDLDLVVVIAYGVLLPIEIINIPRYGFINLHFSLLPKWRGAAPVARAILNGDRVSGVTVFALEAGMDSGPIYVQKEFAIGDHQNTGDVLKQLADLGPSVISDAIELLNIGKLPIPQSTELLSFAPKTSKAEARIHWNQSAQEVDRHIRAFTPEPGSWTTFRGQSLVVTAAAVSQMTLSSPVGTIEVHSGVLHISCAGESSLEIKSVTPSGKKNMPASSWINGARLQEGELFE